MTPMAQMENCDVEEGLGILPQGPGLPLDEVKLAIDIAIDARLEPF